MATSTQPLTLPSDWRFEENPDGADLRVVSSKRRYIAIGSAVLAGLAATRAITHWHTKPEPSWLVLAGLLGLFALWCAMADEVWHLQRNCIIHRVGIGAWGRSRSCRDAELEIAQGFSTKWSHPFYRLYAVANGEFFLIMERDLEALTQLAKFISTYTDWQMRPADMSLMGGSRISKWRTL
jgi:hypothetical protein